MLVLDIVVALVVIGIPIILLLGILVLLGVSQSTDPGLAPPEAPEATERAPGRQSFFSGALGGLLGVGGSSLWRCCVVLVPALLVALMLAMTVWLFSFVSNKLHDGKQWLDRQSDEALAWLEDTGHYKGAPATPTGIAPDEVRAWMEAYLSDELSGWQQPSGTGSREYLERLQADKRKLVRFALRREFTANSWGRFGRLPLMFKGIPIDWEVRVEFFSTYDDSRIRAAARSDPWSQRIRLLTPVLTPTGTLEDVMPPLTGSQHSYVFTADDVRTSWQDATADVTEATEAWLDIEVHEPAAVVVTVLFAL